MRPCCLAIMLQIALASAALAADPVRYIGIYVQPYYQAARTPADRPEVAVGEGISGLLASTRRQDIEAARDRIVSDPALVTPMTLMVLAIRLYDVGLRDDAVLWFYAAKDRFITLAEVVDVRASGLAQVEDAVKSFATLAGPIINGYAFCDLARQQALRRKALDWVEQNPYRVIFLPRLVAKPGDRGENLKAAMRGIRAGADKERAHFDDPKNVAQFYATRESNQAGDRFCWR